jgi:hypothetical protein
MVGSAQIPLSESPTVELSDIPSYPTPFTLLDAGQSTTPNPGYSMARPQGPSALSQELVKVGSDFASSLGLASVDYARR